MKTDVIIVKQISHETQRSSFDGTFFKSARAKKAMAKNLHWGLGIEHEMLLLDRVSSANRICVASSRIVERVNIDLVRKAFDAVDSALSIKLPRLFERALGRGEPIRLSSVPIADPYISLLPGDTFDSIVERLKKVPVGKVSMVLETIAPYVTPELVRKLLPNLLEADSKADALFSDVDPSVALFFIGVTSNDPKKVKPSLAHVLAGTPALRAFRKKLDLVVSMSISPRLAHVGPGSLINGHMRDRYPSLELTPTLLPKSKIVRPKKKGSQRKQYDSSPILVAGAIHLMQSQVPLEFVSWLGYDAPFAEVRTVSYLSTTVSKIADELERSTRKVLKLFPGTRALEHSGYEQISFVDPNRSSKSITSPRSLYAGSFHFWFTLPHERIDAAFAKDHVAFAHAMQWMEPLLVSLNGCDPGAIGRRAARPRASPRSVQNYVGGYGTTDTCSLSSVVDSVVKEGYPMVYYQSPEEFWKFVDGSSQPSMGVSYLKTDRTSLFVAVPNVGLIAVPGCVAVDRTPVEWDDGDEDGAIELESHMAPHNQILKMAYGAGYRIQEGTDVRVLSDWCRALKLRLKPHWKAHPVRVGDHFQLFFHNSLTSEGSEKVPLDPHSCELDSRGFEFRAIDNMPRENVKGLLNLFILIAAASRSVKCRGRVQASTSWSQTIADVSVRGRHARVSESFVSELGRALNLSVRHVSGEEAFEALERFSSALFFKHKNDKWVALMAPDMTGPPRFVDSNALSYEEAFADYEVARPDIGRLVREGSLGELGASYEYDLPYLVALFKKVSRFCEAGVEPVKTATLGN